ncbi:MAG: SDR family oxidoreductase [Gammaproteobacteria bacterium]
MTVLAAPPHPVPKSNDDLAAHPTIFAPGLLAGRTIFVSGAGSGIGRATAWLAARLGARVVIGGRKADKLAAVVDSINAREGLQADYVVVDIRERDAVDAAFVEIGERFGGIDMLVNSAGGQFPQAAIDYSEKGWQTVINTNLNGTWHMMQAAALAWREAGRGGSIVNVVVVNQGLYGVAHTSAARAGVIAFAEKAAVEWAPYGIRVNCVAPGAIETEGWAVYSEQARSRYPRTNPMMRAGSPWEIAEACVFLAGPGGSFINGETLVVDGGGQHWGEVWTTGKPEYYAAATRVWDDGGTTPGG